MTLSLLKCAVRSEHDVFLTRQSARQIAALLGFDAHDQTRIATAVSEVARNAVQHGGGGRVEFEISEDLPQSLIVHVQDKGPGIANVEPFMSDTAAAPCRSTLCGVRQLMDSFDIKTAPGRGVHVTLVKRRPRRLPPIKRDEFASIEIALKSTAFADPLVEMQRQNHELLRTLEELQSQQEERERTLHEIEELNRRLERSIEETHHRVKNNLQVISALVDLQLEGDSPTVPSAALARIGLHSRYLATIHDLLTREARAKAPTETIPIEAVLDKLVPLLRATAGGRRIEYRSDDLSVTVQEGASIALLVSEIVSNCVKHGKGDIRISLGVGDYEVRLEISDEGQGFPPGFDPKIAANTGLNLIETAARHDLNGSVNFENADGGGRVVVVFPLRDRTKSEEMNLH